ncbi:related to serum paraoxonase/arylesterase [Rhynchosporium agropyri]|uniref:Related to serum paraoxonase/arylesterase n=1 Tax=Rhynchosporium agropyri TaxID=914238 RepID=A0A1E1K691_9HELO|nr:related to serum paraoxonase/arylesterase [Rhynchosporium agropyri]
MTTSGRLISRASTVGVVFIAILYQFVLKSLIFGALGYGRKLQFLRDFPNIQCEKIDNLGLEGCEDMWLHDKTGFLYMACSSSQSRVDWLPAVGHLNATGRGLTDRMAVLDTRGPGSLASRLKWLSTENFSGINGDGTLNLHGFDIRADEQTGILHVLLINHRPPFDPMTGKPLDASKIGANSTFEQFQTKPGTNTMRHVRTYANDVIKTPNRVAWVTEDTFVFTNYLSAKAGLRSKVDPLIGGGNVAYCHHDRCKNASPSINMAMPNGLVRGPEGVIYVPSTINGSVSVYTLTADHNLQVIHTIKTGIPIDNLSVDRNGDIIAAAIPQAYKWIETSKAPFDKIAPSTVLRIRRISKNRGNSEESKSSSSSGLDYEVGKIMEDDGSTLPGSTVAVHDAETGRYFMGGAMSPYITICESR